MFRSKNNDWIFLGIGLVVCSCFYSVAVKTVGREKPEVRSTGHAYNQSGMPSTLGGETSQKKGDARRRLQQIYTSQIGIREATGKNDGPEVEEYLSYVGLTRGNAWCAAFVSWVFGQAEMGGPKTAWSPALFPNNRLTTNPKYGDIFGIYFSELKRIAHCGFIDKWDGTWCITVEANTNDIGSVTSENDPNHPIRAGPGEGVYRKKRLVKTINKVADWISESIN